MRTLWTDAPDAPEQLKSLSANDAISAPERDELAHFIEHGWVVMRKAIEPKLIDRFVKDIRGHHRHPGMFITTDHRNNSSKLRLSGDKPETFESLFDLYVNLRSSRNVCMHPRIARFMRHVFQGGVIAMQQLLFQRSNGHQVHQDTAFVAVEEPLLLTASWIALEDVVEGSGELAYYDRSHKLPQYLFADGSKRFGGDMQTYVTALETACRERNLAYERFMAKKGDVFIWAADLVHRSHPRTLPPETSRLSCVTHYCPADTQPFWFRFHPDNHGIEPHEAGGFVSSYYKLPIRGRMVHPNRDPAA